jgi:hypothetical protein
MRFNIIHIIRICFYYSVSKQNHRPGASIRGPRALVHLASSEVNLADLSPNRQSITHVT